MAGKAEKAKFSDRQLSWPYTVAQRICIQLMGIYYRFFCKLTIRGRENQPKGWQSYIVACNHSSSLDPPLVSFALYYQPISYMAKMELFENYWMGLYNYLMASIPVNREKLELSTVKNALKVLKTGKWALGIFPGGTRTQDGSVGEAKRGVAYFAKSANVPVLPMAILYSKPPGQKKQIDVLIGQLIPPEGDMDALGQTVTTTITDLLNELKRGYP